MAGFPQSPGVPGMPGMPGVPTMPSAASVPTMGGGGFDIGQNQLQMVGMVIDMLINTADEKYRASLKSVDGKTIMLDFGDMGCMVMKVKEDKIITSYGRIKNPTTAVLIKKEPNELLEMLSPVLAPILGPVVPLAMPLLLEGISLRKILKLVVGIIPAIPSFIPTVRMIVGGLLKRTAVIKGSITPLLPLAEVILIPFLTGEEDPEWLERKTRDMKEFEAGPPPGWGV